MIHHQKYCLLSLWTLLYFQGVYCFLPNSSLSRRLAKLEALSFNPEQSDNHFSSVQPHIASNLIEQPRERRSFLLKSSILSAFFLFPKFSVAAPPIAIIAEEMGYFPVTNKAGETVYIPSKIKRYSTDQAIALAKHLKSNGVVMYGAYWCPHCQHQKELFGKEAWSLVNYVECSPKGYYFNKDEVGKVAKKLDGFPTWKLGNVGGKSNFISGEMPLERIAKLSNYEKEWDVVVEGPEIGFSGTCNLRKA